MKYLKIPRQTYQDMLMVLGQRPFNEVHVICRGLHDGYLRLDDGDCLIPSETVQLAVNFMHTRCTHCEVHEILKSILACPEVDVPSKPAPRGRKASETPKT